MRTQLVVGGETSHLIGGKWRTVQQLIHNKHQTRRPKLQHSGNNNRSDSSIFEDRIQLKSNQMYNIIDYYPILTEPKLPNMIPPMVDYPLASLVECMRLILFIFIVTISMSLSHLATSTLGLFVDIVSNFDEHFVRLVPILLT